MLYIDGPASIATYQETLANVMFDITADEPDLTERVICFVVNDGLHLSNPVCVTLTIEPRNDHAPRLSVEHSGEVFVEQSGPVLLLSNVSIIDPDHPQIFPMQQAEVRPHPSSFFNAVHPLAPSDQHCWWMQQLK